MPEYQISTLPERYCASPTAQQYLVLTHFTRSIVVRSWSRKGYLALAWPSRGRSY